MNVGACLQGLSLALEQLDLVVPGNQDPAGIEHDEAVVRLLHRVLGLEVHRQVDVELVGESGEVGLGGRGELRGVLADVDTRLAVVLWGRVLGRDHDSRTRVLGRADQQVERAQVVLAAVLRGQPARVGDCGDPHRLGRRGRLLEGEPGREPQEPQGGHG